MLHETGEVLFLVFSVGTRKCNHMSYTTLIMCTVVDDHDSKLCQAANAQLNLFQGGSRHFHYTSVSSAYYKLLVSLTCFALKMATKKKRYSSNCLQFHFITSQAAFAYSFPVPVIPSRCSCLENQLKPSYDAIIISFLSNQWPMDEEIKHTSIYIHGTHTKAKTFSAHDLW